MVFAFAEHGIDHDKWLVGKTYQPVVNILLILMLNIWLIMVNDG